MKADKHSLPPIFLCDPIEQLDPHRLIELRDWQSRFRQLMTWGQLISNKPELRVSDWRVKGCETGVWLQHRAVGEHHYFALDADSKIIKGLGAFLVAQLHGHTTSSIQALKLGQVIQQCGINHHLSPSRNNGFHNLIHRAYALAGCSPDLTGENDS